MSDSDSIWGDGDADEQIKLRNEHHKMGYVDGVTATKESLIQEGFDLGYPVGAEMGLAVGRILGHLQAKGSDKLLHEAEEELSAKALFCDKYWLHDAEPRYAGQHPLIEKWLEKSSNL